MSLPTLSIVIATYNSARTLPACLRSIHQQIYPKDRIELIVSDGGSTDDTIAIAKRFGATVVRPDTDRQGAEINRAYGVHRAKNDLLVLIDHDNILPDRTWLKDMVKPFLERKTIIGAETLRYCYDARMSLLDRYFALFGVNDPLPFYLGKADRLSYLYDEYNLSGKAMDCGAYYLVQFDRDRISTLGANGCLIRRKILMDHAKVWPPENFFHIDVHVDLIHHGFNQYAFVKNSIIHLSAHHDLVPFFRRRRLFMEQYHLTDLSRRRYSVYGKRDFWRLVYFIIISLTFIKPALDALRGFRKIRDAAWFLHPFLCFGTTIMYGVTLLEWQVKQRFKRYEK